ncbi:TROVE domain-containing protein [Candidatus Dependentiae bacterium]|nr:MAG: TROVE domain-containing protein [Candidatus Dependentiae bacterium]
MSKFAATLNVTPTRRPSVPRTLAAAAAAANKPMTQRRVLRTKARLTPPPVVTAPHHYATPNTVNEAGGLAFRKSIYFELLSLVFTALLTKRATKFYQSDATVLSRMQRLVQKDPYFAAQVAVWARRVLGLRSISHAVAAAVCYHTKGQGHPWVREFVEAVVFRPDDAIEIVSAYFAFYGGGKTIRKPNGRRGKKVPVTLPYPLKKGLARALGKLDGYQLAKYQKTEGNITLADVFNLVHPRPSAENAGDFRLFIRGELKNTDTWEARLSAAGSDKLKKEEAWCGLFDERKLGYFAALRNVRNILEQAPGAVDALIKQLTNPVAVQRSLILPFQFVKGYKEVVASGLPRATDAARAIEQAVETSLANIPVLPGRTLVCLDESGSMGARGNEESAAGIGSLFAAVVLKSQPNADFMAFSTNAQYVTVNTRAPLFQLAGEIRSKWHSGSTNFHDIFDKAKEKYDNIIILSDGEGWTLGKEWADKAGAPTSARRRYEQKHNALPFIVTFDLAGAGSAMFPENSVAVLAGFSDKVFALLRELRKDPQALVNEVRKTDFASINEADE